jgi:hypothetical protein
MAATAKPSSRSRASTGGGEPDHVLEYSSIGLIVAIPVGWISQLKVCAKVYRPATHSIHSIGARARSRAAIIARSDTFISAWLSKERRKGRSLGSSPFAIRNEFN